MSGLRLSFGLLFACLQLFAVRVSLSIAAEARQIRWQPYTGEAIDGSPICGEVGRIRVPENRTKPDGPTIELAFVRYRTNNPRPGPPIFFLAGGPGGSGVEWSGLVATHPQIRLLEHSDVIGLDQRGTGLSVPNLMDEPDATIQLPLDVAITRDDAIAACQKSMGECVRYWSQRGVDLSAYNTVESADDLEAVRQALGLKKIVIMGSSYGSHLSLAYLRRHQQHVDRAIIRKVEGPDHTWKLPSTVQRHLVRLHEAVTKDSEMNRHVPDLMGLIRTLLQQLERQPVVATLNAGQSDEVTITLGPYDLQLELSLMLAESQDIANIPRQVYRYSQGEWTELAKTAAKTRKIRAQAMTFMMDCSSAATPTRRARIYFEANDPANVLGDAINDPYYPETCAACGDPDLGDTFRGVLECDVPVLFVSGSLDVRTPPSNVEQICPGFAHHGHVLVRNAGHDSRELMSGEFRDIWQSFLRGEPVESCTITLPFMFEPIE